MGFKNKGGGCNKMGKTGWENLHREMEFGTRFLGQLYEKEKELTGRCRL